ncbi:MAG: ABC transporter ATP-binding protein [Clostridiales Family XIII bacterium]|jgi:branched-chain amino acid transport system ATP-binding protein|nr:ABC transporter ATP-binding protein [Clostridiales Family XIII bacterium]
MENTRKEALRIEKLSIQFGGLKALDDLSFTVYENEIFGLIGPNGAGKTTVFNCITQFYKPDAGHVFFNASDARQRGHLKRRDLPADGEMVDLVGKPVHRIIRYGLVRTFQNVEVIPELSLIDNVLIGAHVDFNSTMFEQALRLPRARREEKKHRAQAVKAMEFLGIADIKDQLAGGQPYGILKKIEMTRTLMCEPRLIILDEPAAGLNNTETEELAKIIHMIRENYHCTILLVEHDMRLVMEVCDRICAISFGKFLATGTPAEIQKDKSVQEAYLGEQEDE